MYCPNTQDYNEFKERVIQSILTKLQWFGLELAADVLYMVVDEVAQAICNYCNIPYVPTGLSGVWANMCFDYIRWGEAAKTGSPSSGEGEVTADYNKTLGQVFLSSIKEGNTTVGFSADSNSSWSIAANAHSPEEALQQVVMNYVDQLNRYRKVIW